MHDTREVPSSRLGSPSATTTDLDLAVLDHIVRQNQRMLSVKALAYHRNHHTNYVYLMGKAGFKMPGGRTTLEAARKWLAANPSGDDTYDSGE